MEYRAFFRETGMIIITSHARQTYYAALHEARRDAKDGWNTLVKLQWSKKDYYMYVYYDEDTDAITEYISENAQEVYDFIRSYNERP